MIVDATEELKKKGLHWKEDQMELFLWGLCEKVGDLHVKNGVKKHAMDGHEILQEHRNCWGKETQNGTEKWYNTRFFTEVKAGAVTRKWLICSAWLGQ